MRGVPGVSEEPRGPNLSPSWGGSGEVFWPSKGSHGPTFFESRFRDAHGSPRADGFGPNGPPNRRPKGPRNAPQRRSNAKWANMLEIAPLPHEMPIFGAPGVPRTRPKRLRNQLFEHFRSQMYAKMGKPPWGAQFGPPLGLANGPNTAPKAMKIGTKFEIKI